MSLRFNLPIWESKYRLSVVDSACFISAFLYSAHRSGGKQFFQYRLTNLALTTMYGMGYILNIVFLRRIKLSKRGASVNLFFLSWRSACAAASTNSKQARASLLSARQCAYRSLVFRDFMIQASKSDFRYKTFFFDGL